VANELFTKWLKTVTTPHKGVILYDERPGARSIGIGLLKQLLPAHFVGEATVVQAGGYPKAAAIIANSLPSNKKTQSGDLGELLATEYINSETSFVVPLNKLRWKSDRQMPMHGNDVIGVDASAKHLKVLKGECKSRATFTKNVVEEAVESLDLHEGRPNPSTLAFIAKRLYEEKRDDEANVFRDLQCIDAISARNVVHMVFVLSGNDPSAHLANGPKSKHAGVKRENAAIMITGHGAFVKEVYETNGT